MKKKNIAEIIVFFIPVIIVFIAAVILINTKYIKFSITANYNGKPIDEVYTCNYEKRAVGYETQQGRPYYKDNKNRSLVIDRKINNESGSVYSYPVYFKVNGKKICGFFQFENVQDGIEDSWINDIKINFYYENGILKEDILCSDGIIVEKKSNDSGDFDVVIRK